MMRKNPVLRAALAVGLVVGISCSLGGRAAAESCGLGPVQGVPGGFAYYLMALSIGPTFCDTRAGKETNECANGTDAAYRAKPLTVHGLWPNNYNTQNDDQPRYCKNVPPGQLPSDLNSNLTTYMPGVADNLEKCEWIKHGVCKTLSYEEYYRAVVALATIMENTIGSTITENNLLGTTVKVSDLVSKVAAKDPKLASAIAVDCKSMRPHNGEQSRTYISELHVSIGRDLSGLETGQGPTYIPIDSFGGYPYSGCQNGAGYLPAGYQD